MTHLFLRDAQLLILEQWKWIAGAAVGALLVWISSVSLCSDPDKPAPPPNAGNPTENSEIAALRSALDREVEAREDLARQVTSLREQIERSDGGAEQRSADSPSHGAPRRAFDSDALVAAGVPRRDAQALRERFAAAESEKIQLNDRATREGWAETPEYQKERFALDDRLREELSETDYDRYLYATGRPNRARVTNILAQSPGDDAGFHPGDIVLSYAGERVFSGDEIRERAAKRRPDESVRVEVLRNQSTLTLNVRGGSLGLVFVPEHQTPH
jgi:hypothetical protein